MPYRPDAPYKQSRSVLRKIYGSREIDGRAPQSARDSTPSGRIKYREQQGMSEPDAILEGAQEFQNNFRPRSAGFLPSNAVPLGTNGTSPSSLATPESILRDRAMGAVSGQYQTPFGPAGFSTAPPSTTPLAFNLSEPSTLPASTLSQFAPPGTPSVTAPQAYVPPWRRRRNTGYMGSILAPASRWLS